MFLFSGWIVDNGGTYEQTFIVAGQYSWHDKLHHRVIKCMFFNVNILIQIFYKNVPNGNTECIVEKKSISWPCHFIQVFKSQHFNGFNDSRRLDHINYLLIFTGLF